MTATAPDILGAIRRFNKSELHEVSKEIRGETVIVSKGRQAYQIADDEDKTEYQDSAEEVELAAARLASLLASSKYCVVFTGAGIATSAGIPCYRDSKGVWTLLAEGQAAPKVDLEHADPTPAHMMIRDLVACGVVKHVVSTNLDGLHVKSGLVPHKELSELHGNIYKRLCGPCGQLEHWRRVGEPPASRCGRCSAPLHSSAVAFGQELPLREIEDARLHASRADLAIVLGSSMRVSPACNLPEHAYKNGGHLVICNIQKTPYDKYASVVVHDPIDHFLSLVIDKLVASQAIPALLPSSASSCSSASSSRPPLIDFSFYNESK